jgi:hypothetical protein
VVVCATVIALAALVLTSYERLARSDVQLGVLVDGEIVQVFVNCQLVYPAFTGTTGELASLDLGWLDREAAVTVQVRGRVDPGYYQVTLHRGSRSEVLASAGGFGDPVRVPAGRVAFDRSFTAGGRPIGSIGCQDAPQRFAFAAAAARTPQRWNGDSNAAFDVADAVWPIIQCALALIGAGGLVAAVLLGAVLLASSRGASFTHSSLIAVLGAAAGIVIGLIPTIATHNLDVAVDASTTIGACCLAGLCRWLLVRDIQEIRSRRRATHVDDTRGR